MILNCLLNSLRLNADVALRGGGAAMLQQPLHQGYIVAVIFVNLRCVPLAETVGAYIRVAQVIADDGQLLLDRPFRNGKDPIRAPDAVAQTVVLNVLLDH